MRTVNAPIHYQTLSKVADHVYALAFYYVNSRWIQATGLCIPSVAFFLVESRRGEMRTQNLNSHLVRTQSLNLFPKWMVLHHQILFSPVIAVIAEAILMQTSAEQVPSLHKIAHRYLKTVTSSNFWPFMLISTLMFVLLVMILLFSVLTSILYAVTMSVTTLLKRS